MMNFNKLNIKFNQSRRAFSVAELLVVIAILALVSAMVLASYNYMSGIYSLNSDVDNLISNMEVARNKAQNVDDSSNYGISFGTSSYKIFKGNAVESGTVISTNQLSNGVTLATTTFSNGASQIYFKKLSGTPNATGTVRVMVSGKASSSRTIKIEGSGFIE